MRKKFCNCVKQYPILFSFFVCICMFGISGMFVWDDNPVTGWDKLAGDACITLFCMFFLWCFGLLKKVGFTSAGLGRGLLLGIPFYVIGICAAFVGNLGTDFGALTLRPVSFLLLFTLNMFFVGMNEEVMMRALVLNVFRMKYGETDEGNKKAVLLSALIFGLIHLPNVFFMSPTTVVVQAVNAASAGVLFAVIYLKSGNLWANIIIHMVVDFLSLFVGQCFISGASVLSVELSAAGAVGMILAGSLPPLIVAGVYQKNKKESSLGEVVRRIEELL